MENHENRYCQMHFWAIGMNYQMMVLSRMVLEQVHGSFGRTDKQT
jgi:hypothetical protein